MHFGLNYVLIQPLTLKRLGDQFSTPYPLVVFPKMYYLERESEALLFYDFQYDHKLHLSWKFNRKIFSVNINYVHQFLNFLIFPCVVTKKLMMSAYNRWCQQSALLGLNMFIEVSCLTVSGRDFHICSPRTLRLCLHVLMCYDCVQVSCNCYNWVRGIMK